jgi:hypothetical protein
MRDEIGSCDRGLAAAHESANLLQGENHKSHHREDNDEMEHGDDDDLRRMMFDPFLPREKGCDRDDQEDLSCGPDAPRERETFVIR